MGPLTDDDLMRLYADGDETAFDVLFDRYHVAVFHLARMILRGDGAAEEVLQETFLAVARNAAGYTPKGSFRPWLMRIARNLCLNRLQAERARQMISGAGVDPDTHAGDDVGPADAAETRERAALLRRAIERLPDDQRQAIALYSLDEITYREIAEVMGKPLNTIKTLIRRGRSTLARELEPYWRG